MRTEGIYSPTEAEITRAILDYLQLIGAWVFKVHGHLGQRPGIPDILACYRGRFIAIEVKKPGGRLSPRQAEELEAIRGAGGIGLVVSDVEEVIRAMDNLSLWITEEELS